MYRSTAHDSDSDSDKSEGETSWKRAPRTPSEAPTSLTEHPPEATANVRGGPRGRNTVWRDIVQEDALTGTMTLGFGVQGLPNDSVEDRGVESYDYTRARLDPRPSVPPIPTEVPDKLLELRAQRAQKIRSRLGVPKSIEKVEKVDEQSTADDTVTQKICQRLKEPKSDLIGRAVTEIGAEKALELLYAAETIEANGGLMINNGSRRRTPGGVFLHLLRTDPQIDKATVNKVFEVEVEERKVAAKRRKRGAMEKKAAKVIQALEQQLFGDETRPESSDDEQQMEKDIPVKRATLTEEQSTRTSDLEDGEIDD